MTTIQQIEGRDWGTPAPDASFLVQRCTELRRKPLETFTVEDLRIMLGQEIAVPILLPLAVDVLTADLHAEGDYYPGDLLWAVLRLPASAWSVMPGARQRLAAAVAVVDLDDVLLPDGARDAVASFLRTTM